MAQPFAEVKVEPRHRVTVVSNLERMLRSCPESALMRNSAGQTACEGDKGIRRELRLVRQDAGSQNPGDCHRQVSKER